MRKLLNLSEDTENFRAGRGELIDLLRVSEVLYLLQKVRFRTV